MHIVSSQLSITKSLVLHIVLYSLTVVLSTLKQAQLWLFVKLYIRCMIYWTIYTILYYYCYFYYYCYICDLQFNWCLPPPPPPTLSHVFRLMADLSKFNMRERITTLQSSKEPFWRTPRKVGQSPGTMAIHGTAEKIAIHEIGNRDDW